MSGPLLPPVSVASLALLAVGGLGLLIGGLDDGTAVTAMAVVVLLVAGALAVRHLRGVLAGQGTTAAAVAASSATVAPAHRTVAWVALAAASGAAVLMPVLFTLEAVPGWVAVLAVGDGLLALPAGIWALRAARTSGDVAGARLAAFAAGAGVVVLLLVVVTAIAAIGIASSPS